MKDKGHEIENNYHSIITMYKLKEAKGHSFSSSLVLSSIPVGELSKLGPAREREKGEPNGQLNQNPEKSTNKVRNRDILFTSSRTAKTVEEEIKQRSP